LSRMTPLPVDTAGEKKVNSDSGHSASGDLLGSYSSERLCDYCGSRLSRPNSAINRAIATGAKLYCDRVCSGMARRVAKTPEQKKAEKAKYDARRRTELADQIKAEKRRWYLANRDRLLSEFAAKRAQPGYYDYHNTYCRQPRYVAEKREYDRRYRAAKQFGGEFADAFLLLQDIEKEIEARASRYEIYLANGTINKAQTRRRALA
jgi:hypothetical protein